MYYCIANDVIYHRFRWGLDAFLYYVTYHHFRWGPDTFLLFLLSSLLFLCHVPCSATPTCKHKDITKIIFKSINISVIKQYKTHNSKQVCCTNLLRNISGVISGSAEYDIKQCIVIYNVTFDSVSRGIRVVSDFSGIFALFQYFLNCIFYSKYGTIFPWFLLLLADNFP